MSSPGKVKVVVIGVGYLGQWHARKLAAMESAELVAVVDIEQGRANGLASELGCKPIADYREIPRYAQAAVVAVPTARHFEVARYLLDSGVDLLVEKPLGADLEKATLLADMSANNGNILAVGLVERFNPGIAAGMKAVNEPKWIQARRLSPFKERTRNVDVVRDLMIHDLDIAQSIAGAKGEVINAIGVSVITDLPDAVRAHLRFENGVEAFLEASRINDDEVRQIEVFDKPGRLLMDSRQRAAIRYRPSHIGMEPRVLPTSEDDPLESELRDFVEAVANRTKPRVTCREGLDALRLATAILRRIGHHDRGA